MHWRNEVRPCSSGMTVATCGPDFLLLPPQAVNATTAAMTASALRMGLSWSCRAGSLRGRGAVDRAPALAPRARRVPAPLGGGDVTNGQLGTRGSARSTRPEPPGLPAAPVGVGSA